jgi:diacylglycerol kinase family enzyme
MERAPSRKFTVVLNRASGTVGRLGPEKVEAGLREILERAGCEVEISSVEGDGIEGALRAAREGDADVVVVGGGDGTVSAAATLFAGQDKPLGVLPLGTFNLAARDVGMPLEWEVAAELLVTAPVVEIDLMEVGGKVSLCVIVLGFYPALALGRPDYHGNWVVKMLRTLWEVSLGAATYPPLDLLLKEGDTVHRLRSRLALLANNDYQDMFGVLPVRQSLDAGHFTVYVSTHHSPPGLIVSGIAWALGRWSEDREIVKLRASELVIDVKRKGSLSVMIDGELKKIVVPFEVKLLPRALRIIAPGLGKEEGRKI